MELNGKLIISPSPHVKDRATTSSVMLNVIIAMAPAMIAGVIIFGVQAAVLMAVCVVACVLFEYLFNAITHKPQTISDLSAVVTGILLALNLPPTFPLYMAVVGCFVAIVIAKQLFGGIGCNFANPAILARVVLLVSFSQAMTTWMVPTVENGALDLVSGATPLGMVAAGKNTMPYMDMLLGLKGGCVGEVCALALLIGGVYLVVTKTITATTPLVFFGTVAVFALLIGQDPIAHLLTGGVMLGAIFMATDYSTSPITEKGKAVFAVGCGLLTMVIRVYGSYPEGVSFAILIMNILTPHIDSLTRSKPFGALKIGGAKK